MDKIARPLVIVFRLAGESYDNVGRDCDTVARLPDASDKIDIFFRGIGAVHRFEDSVGARLQRQMNVLSQFRQTRDRINQVVAKTNRVRGSKTKPFESIDFIHRFE